MPWKLSVIDNNAQHIQILGDEDVLRPEYQKWALYFEAIMRDEEPEPVMIHVIGWTDWPYAHVRELRMDAMEIRGMVLEQVRVPTQTKKAPDPAPTTN